MLFRSSNALFNEASDLDSIVTIILYSGFPTTGYEPISTSVFSETMKQRAKQIHEFGNLIIKVADPHDILIMKSVTSRAKDLDDIIAIVNKSQVDWDLIVKEAEEQVKLGNETAIMGLGEKLEKLSERKIIEVPKNVLDKLWKLLSKQVKNKSKKN